jgi:hypothetical protein
MIRHRGTARSVCTDRSEPDARLRHAEGVGVPYALTDWERDTAPQPPGCPQSARARTAGQIARGDGLPWGGLGRASRAGVQVPRASPFVPCTDADCPPRPGAFGPNRPGPYGLLMWRSQRIARGTWWIWMALSRRESLSRRLRVVVCALLIP